MSEKRPLKIKAEPGVVVRYGLGRLRKRTSARGGTFDLGPVSDMERQRILETKGVSEVGAGTSAAVTTLPTKKKEA